MKFLRCLFVVAICGFLAVIAGPERAAAADPAFVGKLALAAEPDVAQELGLSEDVQAKLAAIVDKRESEAVNLAAELRGLTPEEQNAKMAPFVAESEKQGLELLTDEQQAKLGQLHVAKAGMAGLADPSIAAPLKITAEQKAQIDKLVGEFKSVMATGSDTQKQAARIIYEKKIAGLLTDEQKAAWEKMSGVPAGATATAAATAASSQPGSDGPSGGAPAAGGSNGRYAGAVVSSDGKLRFSFRYAPWKDVIDWFAQQAGLSLVTDVYPPGTFNYTDTKAYTPEEALDVLNRILATKGFTLVRSDKMVILFNLEDGPVPKEFVPIVQPEELDKLGSFELVSCVFQLTRMTPEEAEIEVNKLRGPQGSVVLLSKARQIWVTEHAGKLRTIRTMIEAIENPTAPKDERFAVITLKHLMPSEFMAMARTALGIPDNAAATPDGTLRISQDELGGKILVSGKQAAIERVEEIVKLVDVDSGEIAPGADPLDQPQLEVYPVTQADPAAVLQVMQTLLAGLPDVRLASDPKTGNLVALAKPSDHATIRATLDQMQRDGSQMEVYKLRTLDPSSVMLEINSLLGDPTGKDPTAAAKAPRVFADAINMTLTVYGNAGQLERIRELLEKKGELGGDDSTLAGERSNIRVLPLTGRAQRSVLDQLTQVWPQMRSNRIRIIPSKSGDSGESASGVRRRTGSATAEPEYSIDDFLPFTPEDFGPNPEQPKPRAPGTNEQPKQREPQRAEPTPVIGPTEVRRTQPRVPGVEFVSKQGILVSQPLGVAQPLDAKRPASDVADDGELPAAEAPTPAAAAPAEEAAPAAEPAATDGEPAEIVITTGPGGITIASKDLEALDDMEELIQSLNDTIPAGKDFNVYYLKYVKAENAANLLTEVMSGSSGAAEEEGGGGLMGDLASQMMGGMTGDLLGGILGPSSGGTTTTTGGTLSIIPDPRLNALFVQASARDLDSIEQLLEVIDTKESIEAVETTPAARFIPVFNGNAESIAGVVRTVFASRMQADAAQPRQPSPEDFIRALRGGGGGRGGNNRQQNRGEEQKMTIGVDTESNSLIVSAPDYLFKEVQALVSELDRAANRSDETVRVVTLKKASTDLVQRSLVSVLGANATVNTTSGTTTSTSSSRPTGSSTSRSSSGPSTQPGQPDPNQDAVRQQMQFMQDIQRRMQEGGGRGDRGGDRGGGDRGSRGGDSGRSRGGAPGGGIPGGGFPGFPGGFPGGRP